MEPEDIKKVLAQIPFAWGMTQVPLDVCPGCGQVAAARAGGWLKTDRKKSSATFGEKYRLVTVICPRCGRDSFRWLESDYLAAWDLRLAAKDAREGRVAAPGA